MEVVRNFIAEQMVELLSTTFLIAVYMIAMFAMNVKISLFVFAFIPVIVSYSLVFYKRISKGYQKADEAEGELSSAVQENITGVRVVRAFGQQQYEVEKFTGASADYKKKSFKVSKLLAVYWAGSDTMCMIQSGITLIMCVLFGRTRRNHRGHHGGVYQLCGQAPMAHPPAGPHSVRRRQKLCGCGAH